MGRRVLVTGAARSTGRRLVAALAEEPEVERVVAVDDLEPEGPFPDKVEHLAVDLRSPALVRAVQSAGIDTCVHLGVTAEPRAAGGRVTMKERNVLGTMQLLAAAYHAPDLRRLVLKSTTAVYGSDRRRPGGVDREHVATRRPGTASARTPSRSRTTSAPSTGAGPTSR